MHADLAQAARDAIDAQGGPCTYQCGNVTASITAVIRQGVQIENEIGQATRVNTVRAMVQDTANLKKGATFQDLESGITYGYMTTLLDNGITRLMQVSVMNAEV